MASAPTLGAIEDPEEVEYLRRRRLERRRRLRAVLIAATLAAGYLAWKAGTHLVAAYWLGLSRYKVSWSVDRENWMRGGVTTVRSDYNFDSYQGARADGELRFFSWLHRVEELDLSKVMGLRDDELVRLDELTGLRSLSLDRTSQPEWRSGFPQVLTDATLVRIGRLKGLRELDLGGQPVTEAGLANLAGLDQLQSLNLDGTGLSDSVFELLRRLPRLRTVDLTGTRVTAQGLSNFEASRPGVRVAADPPPIPPVPAPRANR